MTEKTLIIFFFQITFPVKYWYVEEQQAVHILRQNISYKKDDSREGEELWNNWKIF